ncbi:MAG: hypothetical protein WC551_07435 [Patescibacteria group bacterium]
MGLLHNTFKLTDGQRKAVAILALVFTLNSTRVQAAEQTSVLPDAPKWETGQVAQDDMVETGLRVPGSINGEFKEAKDVPPLRVKYVTVTAYSSTPGETDGSPFTTADGSRVRDGIIAANFLRFGTRVRIPELFGGKIFEVRDRMHPRFSGRVDIWMPSSSEGRKFGLKHNVKIEIL